MDTDVFGVFTEFWYRRSLCFRMLEYFNCRDFVTVIFCYDDHNGVCQGIVDALSDRACSRRYMNDFMILALRRCGERVALIH